MIRNIIGTSWIKNKGRECNAATTIKCAGEPGQPKYAGVFNVINRRWLCDENNNIWIEMFIKDDPEEIVYDVFSPDGIYLKQIKVKHRIYQLWGGKAYSLVRDEDGFVSMKRFKLVDVSE